MLISFAYEDPFLQRRISNMWPNPTAFAHAVLDFGEFAVRDIRIASVGTFKPRLKLAVH